MKLVRDKIPEIIKNNGAEKEYNISSCSSQKERYGYLLAKLQEEAEELTQNPSIEELADVLEVTYTIANELGLTLSEVELYRESKKNERGGFRKGFLLEKANKEF